MANNIFQAKRTSVSGRTPNTTGSYATNSQYIAAGEFGLNMADGILYTSNGSAIIEVGANNSKLVVGTTFIANSTQLTTTVPFSANGSTGSAGQVLTSNGASGSPYWSTAGSGSVNVAATYVWTNTQSFTNTITFGAPAYGSASGGSVVNSTFIGSGNSSVNTFVNTSTLSTKAILANGSIGTAAQILASNGTGVYWANVYNTQVRQQYTGDGSTTSFTVTGGYTANNIDVFVNGIKYYNGTEVTVTSGSSVVFSTAPATGMLIEVVGVNATSFGVRSVTVGTTAPASPAVNDLWLDTNT